MNEKRNSDGNRKELVEVATLGGGCFWCLEAVFNELKGVERVVSGYSGGSNENPSYREVSQGASGHAEVVQIEFDSDQISFDDLLDVFFSIHDPTTLNRQGADIGPQYRSAVFFHNEEQKSSAEQKISEIEAEGVWDNPVVTEVTPFKAFYKAEEYHQEYFKKNPDQGYCRAVITPKVSKFRARFASKLKV
ncbi:MAG: peptide-methionine (S)-S-oxide reductase MsrA [Anaerolineales bacterium]|nr:peptide-methionine (S)-S-oxide reductase MsrA [Anaerolineales bacterium]